MYRCVWSSLSADSGINRVWLPILTARGQLNTGNGIFPVSVRAWEFLGSQKLGSAVPPRVSLLILHTQAEVAPGRSHREINVLKSVYQLFNHEQQKVAENIPKFSSPGQLLARLSWAVDSEHRAPMVYGSSRLPWSTEVVSSNPGGFRILTFW